MAQKWSTIDQKWPNMTGLSTLQSGPKGFKREHLDPFGPFQTRIVFFALQHLWQTLLCPFGQKNHFSVSEGKIQITTLILMSRFVMIFHIKSWYVMPSNYNGCFCMALPPIAWYCMLLHVTARYCIVIFLLHGIACYLMVLNGSKLSPFMPQCGH